MQGKNSRLHFDNSNFPETKKSMINSKQKKKEQFKHKHIDIDFTLFISQ
jgi:hypothetical protein